MADNSYDAEEFVWRVKMMRDAQASQMPLALVREAEARVDAMLSAWERGKDKAPARLPLVAPVVLHGWAERFSRMRGTITGHDVARCLGVKAGTFYACHRDVPGFPAPVSGGRGRGNKLVFKTSEVIEYLEKCDREGKTPGVLPKFERSDF